MKKLLLYIGLLAIIGYFLFVGISYSQINSADPRVNRIAESIDTVWDEFTANAECDQMSPICWIQDESTNVHYYFVITGVPGSPSIHMIYTSKQIVYDTHTELMNEGIKRTPTGWAYFIDHYKIVHTKDSGDKLVDIEGNVEIWDEVVTHLFGK